MKPAAKRGRPPERADRRESIMDAALRCFVERGFHGTSMPEIAEKAHVAAATIYHYFESKEALVNELFRMWKQAIGQRVLTAFPYDGSPREQVRTVWKEMVAFAMAEPTAFAFVELHVHASYLDAESLAVERQLKVFGHAMMERAQREGVVKPLDAWVLMELVFGAFVSMMKAHGEGRIVLTDEVIRDAEQACWDAIAVH